VDAGQRFERGLAPELRTVLEAAQRALGIAQLLFGDGRGARPQLGGAGGVRSRHVRVALRFPEIGQIAVP
jgi:hypothetical protein